MPTLRSASIVLALAGLTACRSAASPPGASGPTRPNVVLILVDDAGSEVFGCYGGESYRTPRVDALAVDGMRFTHAFSQPLCTPSRVKLMTGKSNLRNYTAFSILRPGETTIGHVARAAGYATVVVGKWQLLGAEHYGELAGSGTHPRDAGFDRWCLWQVETLGSRYADPTLDVDGELRRDIEGAYGPDVACDYLLDFAAEHRERPFFAYYPMALVHDPFEPTPWTRDREQERAANFADMVEYMDAIVGRIVDGLEDLGLRDRTLVLFTTDNGTSTSITSKRDGVLVRGGKGRSTDAGTRVPLIASLPGVVAPGTTCDDLIGFDDVLPTLAAVMRSVAAPADVDGRSFAPQLRGERGDPRDVLTLYSNPRPGTGRNPRVFFARDARYKLYDDGRMFDCVDDPLEEAALPVASSEELRAIRRRLGAALAAMPTEPAHLRALPTGD